MYERFTDRARRVLVLAQEEARLLFHTYIGTEHLLLGLLAEKEGVGAKALNECGITLEVARSQVEDIIGRGKTVPSGHIPFTPRAKKAQELSLREALGLGSNYIDTEHLLLGLVREGEGVAAQICVKLGLPNVLPLRDKVVELISAERQPAPAQTTPPEMTRQLATRTLHVHASEEQLDAALQLLQAHFGRIRDDHPLAPIIRAIEQELN